MNSFEDRIQNLVLILITKHFPHDRDGFVEAMVDLFGIETRRSYVNGLRAQPKSGRGPRKPVLTYESALKNGKLHPKQRAAERVAA